MCFTSKGESLDFTAYGENMKFIFLSGKLVFVIVIFKTGFNINPQEMSRGQNV